MKEPTKFSMATGEAVKSSDIKKYPLPSIEQELHNVIQDSKEWMDKNTEKEE